MIYNLELADPMDVVKIASANVTVLRTSRTCSSALFIFVVIRLTHNSGAFKSIVLMFRSNLVLISFLMC